MDISLKYGIKTAELSEVTAIESLIEESVRGLATDDYTKEQIDSALKSAWGLDTQLINDSTYYVVYNGNELIGCGGWSYRETLFGNNNEKSRNPRELNPALEAAKIRAFFIKPAYARDGIGSALMKKCEADARKKGFTNLALMATLPGQRLYSRHGFEASKPIEYRLEEGLSITFVPMKKSITP